MNNAILLYFPSLPLFYIIFSFPFHSMEMIRKTMMMNLLICIKQYFYNVFLSSQIHIQLFFLHLRVHFEICKFFRQNTGGGAIVKQWLQGWAMITSKLME